MSIDESEFCMLAGRQNEDSCCFFAVVLCECPLLFCSTNVSSSLRFLTQYHGFVGNAPSADPSNDPICRDLGGRCLRNNFQYPNAHYLAQNGEGKYTCPGTPFDVQCLIRVYGHHKALSIDRTW